MLGTSSSRTTMRSGRKRIKREEGKEEDEDEDL